MLPLVTFADLRQADQEVPVPCSDVWEVRGICGERLFEIPKVDVQKAISCGYMHQADLGGMFMVLTIRGERVFEHVLGAQMLGVHAKRY